MEIEPKKLMKLLTPLATLTGAVKSADSLTPDGNLDRWSESILQHGREAEQAIDQLMDIFLQIMDEQQPEQESGWQPIETCPGDKYVEFYCAKGFFSPEQVFEIGTRAQWEKTATHWKLPSIPTDVEGQS